VPRAIRAADLAADGLQVVQARSLREALEAALLPRERQDRERRPQPEAET
jgi:hypothetical protein